MSLENDNTDFEWESKWERLRRSLKLVKRNQLFDEEKAWLQMQDRIQFATPSQANNVRSLKWIRYAAAVLLPLITATIFLVLHKNDEAMKSQIAITDIRITTADGQTLLPAKLLNRRISTGDGLIITIDETGLIQYSWLPTATASATAHTLEVPAGKMVTMQLPDGSKVWLNSTSSLSYAIGRKQRTELELLSGEACFDIVPQSTDPVQVKVNDSRVYVLGTCFNISIGTNKPMQTTLVRGKIKVERNSDIVMLSPNEQVSVNPETNHLIKKQVPAADYITWTNNTLYFDNERLEDITEKLSEVYGCHFRFAEPALKELHFTVDLEKYPQLQPVLNYISTASGLIFKADGNAVLVSRKPAR